MKRICALLLTVSILLCAVASAVPEDNTNENQSLSSLSLSFGDIEKLVLSNNPTVKSNNNTLESMKDPDGMIAARNKLFTEAAKLEMSVNAIIGALGGAVSSNLLQLSFAANYLKAQAQEIKAPGDDDIEEMKWQLDQVNNTMVTVVETLYTSFLSTERKLAYMEESAKLMDRNLTIMELRYEFGQITSLDLESFRNQKQSLDSGIITLESGLETLKGEINMQLGRSFDAPLTLEPLGSPELTYIEQVDRSGDLNKAIASSYALKIKERAIEDLDDEDADDKKYDTFKRDYENKVMAANVERETIRFSQQKLLQSISEKTRTYKLEKSNFELAEKKLNASELKYELGTISEIDLLSAKLEWTEQSNRTGDASDALASAIQSYKWFLRGLYSASSGTSANS